MRGRERLIWRVDTRDSLVESLKWVGEEVGAGQLNGIMGKGSGLAGGVQVVGWVGKTKTRQHVSQSTPPPLLLLLLLHRSSAYFHLSSLLCISVI